MFSLTSLVCWSVSRIPYKRRSWYFAGRQHIEPFWTLSSRPHHLVVHSCPSMKIKYILKKREKTHSIWFHCLQYIQENFDFTRLLKILSNIVHSLHYMLPVNSWKEEQTMTDVVLSGNRFYSKDVKPSGGKLCCLRSESKWHHWSVLTWAPHVLQHQYLQSVLVHQVWSHSLEGTMGLCTSEYPVSVWVHRQVSVVVNEPLK